MTGRAFAAIGLCAYARPAIAVIPKAIAAIDFDDARAASSDAAMRMAGDG